MSVYCNQSALLGHRKWGGQYFECYCDLQQVFIKMFVNGNAIQVTNHFSTLRTVWENTHYIMYAFISTKQTFQIFNRIFFLR